MISAPNPILVRWNKESRYFEAQTDRTTTWLELYCGLALKNLLAEFILEDAEIVVKVTPFWSPKGYWDFQLEKVVA